MKWKFWKRADDDCMGCPHLDNSGPGPLFAPVEEVPHKNRFHIVYWKESDMYSLQRVGKVDKEYLGLESDTAWWHSPTGKKFDTECLAPKEELPRLRRLLEFHRNEPWIEDDNALELLMRGLQG